MRGFEHSQSPTMLLSPSQLMASPALVTTGTRPKAPRASLNMSSMSELNNELGDLKVGSNETYWRKNRNKKKTSYSFLRRIQGTPILPNNNLLALSKNSSPTVHHLHQKSLEVHIGSMRNKVILIRVMTTLILL